ncbi:MAG: CvpA family protein [Alphaproteobacteria bacterium]
MIFDILIVIFLLLASLYGLWRGFAQTVFLLFLLCASIYVTVLPHVLPFGHPVAAFRVLNSWILFIFSLIVLRLVFLPFLDYYLIRLRRLQRLRLQWTQRGLWYEFGNLVSMTAGVALGAVILIMLWFTAQAYKPSFAQPQYLASARSYGYFVNYVIRPAHGLLLASLPGEFRLPDPWAWPRAAGDVTILRLKNGEEIVLPRRGSAAPAERRQERRQEERQEKVAGGEKADSSKADSKDDILKRAYETAEGEREVDKALDQYIKVQGEGARSIAPTTGLESAILELPSVEEGDVDVRSYQKSVNDALNDLSESKGGGSGAPGASSQIPSIEEEDVDASSYQESVKDALNIIEDGAGGSSDSSATSEPK